MLKSDEELTPAVNSQQNESRLSKIKRGWGALQPRWKKASLLLCLVFSFIALPLTLRDIVGHFLCLLLFELCKTLLR